MTRSHAQIFPARFKMKPKTKKQRFSSLSSEEIQTLVDNKDSENTKKATKYAIATLVAFSDEAGLENPESLSLYKSNSHVST